MKKTLLNRGQIALVMIGRIFEMDDEELSDAFETATGHTITVADSTPETGDVWTCNSTFEGLVEPSLSPIVNYLQSQLPR